MKIVVVGGAGRVGRRVVSELQPHKDISVIVADRARPDDPGQKFIAVDLADSASLRSAFDGADVVINTSGPFDRWGTVVLDAAIDVGTNYIDVCDDPEPTLEMIGRDAAARKAGIRAVIGLGVSPGVTNYLAVLAARNLDTVDLLTTFWGDSAEGRTREQATERALGLAVAFEEGRAAYTHLIVQTSSEVQVWRDHAPVKERAWRRAYRVSTSRGETGIYRVIGHPEPVTLPNTLRTRDCLNIGTVDAGADRLMLPVLDRIIAGEIDAQEALREMARQLRENPASIMTERHGDPLPRKIGAAAVGERDGRRDGVVVFPGGELAGSMSLVTARPAVVGALHIDEVSIGVHSPEDAFDARTYLGHYARLYWDADTEPFTIDRAGPSAVVEAGS
jgi:hypothetical protein